MWRVACIPVVLFTVSNTERAHFERLEIPCLVCEQLMAFGEASNSHEELRDEIKTSEAEGEIDYESHHQKASLGTLPMVQWFMCTQ